MSFLHFLADATAAWALFLARTNSTSSFNVSNGKKKKKKAQKNKIQKFF